MYRPERLKGAKDEVGAWRAPRILVVRNDQRWPSMMTQFDSTELKPKQTKQNQANQRNKEIGIHVILVDGLVQLCGDNVRKPTDLVEMVKVVSSDKLVVACYLERPASRRQLQLLGIRFLPSYPFAQWINRNTFCRNEDF